MSLFAASFESLIIFVVILLLSAVGNWLKTRKGQAPEGWGDEDGPAPPPRRPGQPAPGEPASPPGPLFDLERELRRMLGQEPEPPPTPPPVLAPASPRETPVSPVSPSPVLAERRDEGPVLVPFPPATEFPKASPAKETGGVSGFDLVPLEESRPAYHRAAPLDAAAQAGFGAVKPGTPPAAFPKFTGRVPRSPEVASVLASLRNPRTAREAILASVILGPPRSLEH